MTRHRLERLRKLQPAEIAWRGRIAADIAAQRASAWLKTPRWDRRELAGVLAPGALDATRSAIGRGRWLDVQSALASHFYTRTGRFVIAPRMRSSVTRRIVRAFPDSASAAAHRADRLLAGKYDVLGYRGLDFDGRDWHYDPVHAKRPPLEFWSTVPYLDPACGDHKIIWELNRHQHWLVLGRAFWLTGDPRYRAACLYQLGTWLDANPPLMGVNWASMLELGFRSLSWIWALNFFADPDIEDSSPWIVDLLLGLDRQLSHIERHLSYYFSPNTHLIGEALALYVAGRVLPELKASPHRAAVGRRILTAEIANQIESDGGHAERSTHYHRYTLDFYLLAFAVARITNDPVAGTFGAAVARLAAAARLLADDRGRLPHLGDDDGGALLPLTGRPLDDIRDSLAIAAALTGKPGVAVGEPPEEACWMLGHPRLAGARAGLSSARPVTVPTSGSLPDTGYYISRSASGDHLVIDGGPHGFLNGGHAHADALSLTFTRRGTPLLIDPGTACYTVDRVLRDRFRSTDLHNTLTLDRRSQSIPRGPFHWAHTAHGSVRRWRTNARFDYFDATHDGYRPLTHRRHVLVMHGDLLVVADCVIGEGTHTATVQWHVDPAWSVATDERGALMSAGGDTVRLTIPDGTVNHLRADVSTGLGWHAPIYGRIEPAGTIRIERSGPTPLWMFSVFGLDPDNAVLAVESMPVMAEAGVLDHSAALRIVRATSVDQLLIAEPADPARLVSWRLTGIETDARMLFVRSDRARSVKRLAMVDGSVVQGGRAPRVQLICESVASDLYLDLDRAGPFAAAAAHLSGPHVRARLTLDDVALRMAPEWQADELSTG